jgi:hypothetical protein
VVANFEALRAVAQRFDLQMDPAEQSLGSRRARLTGVIDGHAFELSQWQANYVYLDARAFRRVPGDLGLALAPAGLWDKLASAFGGGDVAVGDPTFDRAFCVRAQDPSRVAALLDPALRSTLGPWADMNFVATDEDVLLRWSRPLWVTGALTTRDVVSADEIAEQVRSVVGLAAALDAATANVPPSPALAAHVAAFASYARAHGLQYSASPLAIAGPVAGGTLTARASARGKGVFLAIRLTFEPSLATLVRLAPRRWKDLLSRSMHEGEVFRPTGDAAFDAAFVTSVGGDGNVRAALPDAARAKLVALDRDAGDVTLDVQGLSVTTRGLPSPEGFSALLEDICEVERALRTVEHVARGYR